MPGLDVRPAPFIWRSASFTSQGNVRSHNEDAVLELPDVGVWAVADGMGGHRGGETASRMIVQTLSKLTWRALPSVLLDDIEDRLQLVNRELYEAAVGSNCGVVGSTVAVLMAFGSYCLALWAGDSRVYRAQSDSFVCITRDHSEVQALLDEGVIAQAEAASYEAQNVITRAVGGSLELFLDLELRRLNDQDRYLLCSDGLYREVSERDLARHMNAGDPLIACDALMNQALGGRCADNVSAVVVHFSQDQV